MRVQIAVRWERAERARESLASTFGLMHECHVPCHWRSEKFSGIISSWKINRAENTYHRISWIEIVFSVIDSDRAWPIFAIDAVKFSGQGRWADTNINNTSWRCNHTYWRANIPTIDAWRRRDDTNWWWSFAENSGWRSRDSSWWLNGTVTWTVKNKTSEREREWTHNRDNAFDVMIRHIVVANVVIESERWPG